MRIGSYEIEGELGRGGMGIVYRARDPDGGQVAIKLIAAERAKPDALARFDRERRILAELGAEAGFVPLLDAGGSELGPWIAMPFVGGGTLRDRLAREGELAIGEAIDLAQRLAVTMEAAHARGIVHRDLKPENILFTTDGRPLVADLGVAKHLARDPGNSQSLSRSGELRGTIAFMAPEQIRDAKNVGPPADVYALAAIAFECLTGAPPHRGADPVELIATILRTPAPALRSRRRDAPAWLDRCLRVALDRDPARRPADAGAFARALAAGPASSEPRPTRGRSLGPGIALGATAAVATAVGVVAILGLRGDAVEPGSAATGPGRTTPSIAERLRARSGGDDDDSPPSAMTGGGPPDTPPDPVGVAVDPPVDPDVDPGDPEAIDEVAAAAARDDRLASYASAAGRALVLTEVLGEPTMAHPGLPIVRLAWPRDDLAVSSGIMSTTAIWDPRSSLLRGRMGSRIGGVAALATTPDADRIVTGSGRGTFYLHDADGRLVRELSTVPGRATAAAITADGRFAILGTDRASAPIVVQDIDADPGRPRAIADHPDAAVDDLVVLGEHRFAAVYGDGAIAIHDADSGERLGGLTTPGGSVAGQHRIGASRDGSLVLVTAGQAVEAYDVGSGRVVARLVAHASAVRSVALAPAGPRRAAAGFEDGTTVVWDLDARRRLTSIESVAPGPVRAVAFSPDGLVIARGEADGSIRRVVIETGRALGPRTGAATAAGGVAWLARGLENNFQIATVGGEGFRLWDVEPWAERMSLGGPPAERMAASRDGLVFIRDRADGGLQGWDYRSGMRSRSLRKGAPGDVVTALAVAPDGSRAASAHGGDRVSIWSIDRNAEEGSVAAEGAVAAVAFADTREGLLIATKDGSLRRAILGGSGRSVVLPLGRGPIDPTDLAASGDGRRALSAHDAGEVILWRIEGASARPIRLAEPGPRWGTARVAIAPDGRVGASIGGMDRAVILWNLDTAEAIDRIALVEVPDAPTALAFSPDGRQLAVRTGRQAVLRYAVRR